MASTAPLPAALPTPSARVEFTASDGAVLVADRYDPASSAPAPVVMMFTPYLKSQVIAPFLPLAALIDAGYVVLAVDIRGTGESGGIFEGPLSPREGKDGAEFVEWVAEQEFCDGNVGLASGSYPGAIQFLIAAHRPKGLKAIAPGYAPVDFYRDWTHRGGIPSHTNWGAATFLNTAQPERSVRHALEFYYGLAQATPVDGELFWARSPYRVFDQIEVPVLLIGGLFDYFSRGGVRAFDALDTPKRLVLGPWGHQYPDDPSELLTWFDFWLRGSGADPTRGTNVRQWVIGEDRWQDSEGRAVPERHLSVRLPLSAMTVVESDRALPLNAPPSPVPTFMDTGTNSGMHLWGEAVTVDLDVRDVFIQGSAFLELHVAAHGCDDADLHARLSLVSADGDVQQLTEARLRLSHRALDPERGRGLANGDPLSVHPTHHAPEGLPHEESALVLIEFLPTSVAVRGTDRLRLGLSAVRNDGGARTGSLTFSADSRVLLPVIS